MVLSSRSVGPQIVSMNKQPDPLGTGRRRAQGSFSTAAIVNTAPNLVWQGADYPRMQPGRYLVRGVKVQGPEWVQAFSRWSIRIEFSTVHEPGGVSAFFNLGSDRKKQYIGRQSNYFRAWTLANGGMPRKGEQMTPDVFLEGQFFWVEVGDAERTADGQQKANAEIYSRITKFLSVERA